MTTTENLKTFDTGAVRSRDAEDVRYDLIPPEFLERLAAFIAQTSDDPNQAEWLRGLSMIAMEPLRDLGAAYAEGEKKYTRDNWRKGFPAGCLINHGYRHFEKMRAGDQSENHIGHGLWNFWTLATFAATRPDLMVFPYIVAQPTPRVCEAVPGTVDDELRQAARLRKDKPVPGGGSRFTTTNPPTRETVSQRTVNALRDITERMEAGEDLPCTVVGTNGVKVQTTVSQRRAVEEDLQDSWRLLAEWAGVSANRIVSWSESGELLTLHWGSRDGCHRTETPRMPGETFTQLAQRAIADAEKKSSAATLHEQLRTLKKLVAITEAAIQQADTAAMAG